LNKGLSVIVLCRFEVDFANRIRVSIRAIASYDADIFRRLSVRQSALRSSNGHRWSPRV